MVCGLLALMAGASAAEPPAADGSEAGSANEHFLGRTVALPPYVVSAMRIDKNPWRYGSVPGFEILSRASDENTWTLLDALRRGLWAEDKILASEWRPRPPVPYTVIADSTDLEAGRQDELHELPLTTRALTDLVAWKDIRPTIHNGGVTAGDSDTRALNTNLYDMPTVRYDTQFGFERLDRCAPPLPFWLKAGLYGRNFGLFGGDNVVLSSSGSGERLIFRGLRWVSDEETMRLRKMVDDKDWRGSEVPFIRLGRIFAEPPPQGEESALWQSEAALFVRWGHFEPRGERSAWKRPFLKFVERARHEPVTEKMFTECFGLGFGEMEGILTDYLREMIAQPVAIDPGFPWFPEPQMKAATADQIGRILGDWLRMEALSTRQRNPAMSAKYFDAAGRMLTRAYEMDNGLPPDADPEAQEGGTPQPPAKGNPGPVVGMEPFVVRAERIHDPGLLTVFGLYEHDIGEDSKARKFLEMAVKARVERPSAYLATAQLRYADAVAGPLGNEGKLSTEQAEFILEPAQVALGSSATAETWGLIVDTFARGEVKPSAADIEKMVAGVSQFPAETPLVLRAVQLCFQTGNTAGAAKLIDEGLAFATDEDAKREFQRLRSSIAVGTDSR
jgi:hypothetical protein